jgi:hypothetical protein
MKHQFHPHLSGVLCSHPLVDQNPNLGPGLRCVIVGGETNTGGTRFVRTTVEIAGTRWTLPTEAIKAIL